MIKTDENNVMFCPICGFEYTHLTGIKRYKEKDGRLCVRLNFICEEGHKFHIDFHQHEGLTLINDEIYNYETDHDVML